jgi:hypothetical protein
MARAILLLLVVTASAHAEVDWGKGVVTAEGVGVADRHAPSPAVARGTSRRGAEDQAKKTLATELGKLPLAAGGKVSDKLSADQLAKIAAGAFAVAAEPETDGAWRVTMAAPIEAVRQALAGARAWDAAGDTGPPVVVVEGAAAKPAVGWKLGGADAATIWVDEVPAWAKDAPRVKAKSAKAGAIEIERMPGGPGTLYVVVRNRT